MPDCAATANRRDAADNSALPAAIRSRIVQAHDLTPMFLNPLALLGEDQGDSDVLGIPRRSRLPVTSSKDVSR
jgi:hypothetical protein